MRWLSEVRYRLRALASRRLVERELEEELRDHLERDIANRVRQGADLGTARREALRLFGGVERWKDEARPERGTQLLDEAISDARHTVRRMRRSPGFAAVVVATLAIGVGASTTIFSVVDGVLLKPLPYREPERLVAVWQNNQLEGVEREEPSPANFLDWRARNASFESMASAEPYSVSFQTPDGPQREQTWLVSEDFFSTLGSSPLLGRGLQQADFIPGATPALVIGYGVWQRRFGGDRGVIGRREIVDGDPAVIVGVMPPAFAMPPGRDMWAPKVFFEWDRQQRGRTYYQVIGRLKRDVSIAAASSDMARVASQLEREYPRTNTRSGITLVPLSEQVVGSVRGTLALLMGAAGLLLLIACANVANLMLSRAIDRETEFGLRAALGARRGRIIRQLLGESVVFGLAGGALGVALAWGGVATVRSLAPASLPRVSEMDVDPRVLAFALVASLGTAVLFGLLPAIRLGGVTGERTLQGGSTRMSGGTRRQHGLRSVLVSAEVALSITLLVGAALLGRSFWSLLHVDKGYRTEGVLTVSMFVYDQYRDTAVAVFVREASAKLKSIPGVIAVGMASDLPLARRITRGDANILLEGQPEPATGEGESVEAAEVSPGFFETLGIRLLSGRVVEEHDDERSLPVVVISATVARRHWPNENPIGRRIRVQQFGKPVLREVVGVVADVRRAGLDQTPGPRIYIPHAQSRNGAIAFVIRSSGPPEALIPAVRHAFRELNPALPLEQFTTLDGLQAASLQSRRFILALMTTFATTALLLAAIGVFGLLSRVANERTKEFGVRMALGAGRGEILRMVLRQGGVLVGSGVVAGLVAAVAVAPLVGRFLYGVSPFDGSALIGAAAAMGVLGTLASILPALRATRADPMRAIRTD